MYPTSHEITSISTSECTICLEPLHENIKKLTCDHEFHEECLSRWFLEKEECPICRTKIILPIHQEFILKKYIFLMKKHMVSFIFLISSMYNICISIMFDIDFVLFWSALLSIISTRYNRILIMWLAYAGMAYSLLNLFAFCNMTIEYQMNMTEITRKISGIQDISYKILLQCSIIIQSMSILFLVHSQ